jgi:hypothetical protein
MTIERKAYTRPVLEDLGTATDLTRVGATNPGTDFMQGSVNPPGHDNGMGMG